MSTYEVADKISEILLSDSFNNPPFVSLPIHIIGHSRGAGMAYQIAKNSGKNGIDVEHITSLDPHPLTNKDPKPIASFFGKKIVLDPQIFLYDNIIFADNYYQTINYPMGKYIHEAYNRHWENLPGGYHNQIGYNYSIAGKGFIFSDHLNIILAYYGTIDYDSIASNGQAIIGKTERKWYNESENNGKNTGFMFSRQISGNSKINIPKSVFNDKYLLGLNNKITNIGKGNRTEIDIDNPKYNNIIFAKLIRNNNEISQNNNNIYLHEKLKIEYYYRCYTENCTINMYIDKDRNPFNSNFEKHIGKIFHSNTDKDIDKQIFKWEVSGLESEKYYYICTKIEFQGKVRYKYLDYELFYYDRIRESDICNDN